MKRGLTVLGLANVQSIMHIQYTVVF